MKRNYHPFEKIHQKRGLFLQTGFILSLTLVIMAFQWKTPERKVDAFVDNTEEQIFVMDPVPRTQMKVEVPEAQVDQVQKKIIRSQEIKIKVVDNNVKIKTPIDTTLDFTDFNQNNYPPVDSTEFVMPTVPYRVVSDMPEFPGGNEEIPPYLLKHVKYTEADRSIGIEGTVYVQFVVDETGQVTDVQVIRGVSHNLDRQVVKAVENMPRWKPGKQQGHAVPVYYITHVKFEIQH